MLMRIIAPSEFPEPTAVARPPRRIAIVDDNDGVRLLLRALIELEPDLVVAGEAADGDRALDLVLRESPDLLVLALAMPGTDGLEVLQELGRRDRDTRVVVYSGFGSPEIEEAVRRLGAVDFLVKGL